MFLQLVEIVAFAHRPSRTSSTATSSRPTSWCGGKATADFDLRVTDFGIGGLAAVVAARETRQPTRSRHELLTEAVRGAYTPLYASPEQMLRRPGEPADPRDDVHALGVIWYQLLTGDLGMLSVPPDWREEVQKHGLNEELTTLAGFLHRGQSGKAAERVRWTWPCAAAGIGTAGSETAASLVPSGGSSAGTIRRHAKPLPASSTSGGSSAGTTAGITGTAGSASRSRLHRRQGRRAIARAAKPVSRRAVQVAVGGARRSGPGSLGSPWRGNERAGMEGAAGVETETGGLEEPTR